VAGYVRKRTFKLKFADEEMDGLEVRARSASMERYLEIAQIQDAIDEADSPSAAEYDVIRRLGAQLAEHLVDWNLQEEDGTPVPCTADGLMSQDMLFVYAIVEAWMEAAAGVSAPKAQNSNGGPPSVEASLPMEPLSPSRAS